MIEANPLTAGPASLIQRMPPISLDAERGVLCSVLLDGEALGNLVTFLKADDFYQSAHRHLYEVMLSLYDQGKPVIAVSVVEALRARGLLDRAGGSEYIAELAGAVDTPAHAEYFARIVREKAIARNLIHASSRIQTAAFEETASGAALLELAEAEIFELSKGREINDVQGVDALIRETFDELEGQGVASGVRSGFTTFDEMTGGLKPGELIIVAGRPSMGKTTWALNVARHAASREGKVAAIFSLEMTARNIVKNVLCAEARVDGKKMRAGRFLSDADHQRLRDAASLLFDAKLYVDDTPGLTPTLLRAKARRLKSRHGLDLIVIDYLQLMSGGLSARAQENRQQEISYISRSLKLLARELEVPVIALSQLNRAAEQREGNRPRLSDLRESGAIEQDADLICLLYRPEYYLSSRADEGRRAELAGKAEVIIGKQRNGPTGTVHLQFMKDWLRFDNPAAEPIP